jgi:hypothetical protein
VDVAAVASANMDTLRANPYPGRGIVIGQTPDGSRMVQIYWIMGRSENSRNRIFVEDRHGVRTAPFDASKVKDPSLIIYTCAWRHGRFHIVSNGDQTDTICQALAHGDSFEAALDTREFEPDAPNFTPRIAGLIDLDDVHTAYKLAILKTIGNNAEQPVRHYYNFERPIPGLGHFIATYAGDGSPLPAFDGEPQLVEIAETPDATLDLYWSALNDDNKVSLLVKFIDLGTNGSGVRIVNKNGE